MREVKRLALVARSAGELYALITDIESYPLFVPWCTHARVHSRTPTEIIATLGVRQGALTGEFTTRNTLEPERRVHMRLLSGPFSTLEGEWLLRPLPQGCEVALSVRFAFKSRLTGLMFEPLFARTIESLVDAFVQRARAVP